MNEEYLDNIKKVIKAYMNRYKIPVSDEDDEFLEFKIEEHTQSILNYCNIEELPKELIYVVANRVFGEILENNLNATSANMETGEGIKQITEGDVTVSFSDSSNNIKTTIKYYKSYGKESLHAFRRLRW
ncbi:head-tail connector protein [Peptostreptococcus faecalis]|uniref:phage head-tail connector protein n=1 Tax=Peptostreptococcus faecalis TaxID=2045015 RepID=UPI000C7CF4D0|nr:phage head-tail connector protein [Peptostreptococcus faecalis]